MIRKAKIRDLKEINILGEILHPGFERLFHLETEIYKKEAIILVNEDENKINGYLYAIDFIDNIDLLSIFVDNNYRHQNIASKMLDELIKLSINKTITLEVSSENIPALNLYLKYGFKTVGIRKKYYQNSDALVMKWGI